MRLAERDIVSQQKIRKILEVSSPSRIGFSRSGVRGQDTSLNNAARDGIQEPAIDSLIVSCQGVLVLSVERILPAEFHCVASTSPRHVTRKIVFPGEVIVIPKRHQSAKSISCDPRHEIASNRIRQRRRDGRVSQSYCANVRAEKGAEAVVPSAHYYQARTGNIRCLSRVRLARRRISLC